VQRLRNGAAETAGRTGQENALAADLHALRVCG
jgi:hypothetical protein